MSSPSSDVELATAKPKVIKAAVAPVLTSTAFARRGLLMVCIYYRCWSLIALNTLLDMVEFRNPLSPRVASQVHDTPLQSSNQRKQQVAAVAEDAREVSISKSKGKK